MTTDRETQIAFFKWLEETKSNFSIVKELVDILDISKDSAYRRMRGQTLLTFNEIGKISAHFDISLDTYLKLNPTAVIFQNRRIGIDFTFHDYLQSINENLTAIRKFKEPIIYYLAKDIPVFYHFRSPVLTSFKIFFWLRTIIQDENFQMARYDRSCIDISLIHLSTQIAHQFAKIHSVEIWSDETINVTIRQISYYLDCQVLTRPDALELADELIVMLDNLKYQAEQGKKVFDRTDNLSLNGDFHLYYNEVEIGDNTIFFSMDDKCVVHKTYNMLNILSTSDARFCAHTRQHFHQIMEKSTAISSSAEKERARFFNTMEQKVLALKKKISATE